MDETMLTVTRCAPPSIRLAALAPSHRRVISLVLLVCVVCSAFARASAQESKSASTARMGRSEVREATLDSAFQFDRGNGQTSSLSMALQFLPSFHCEEAIGVRVDRNGTAFIIHMVATVRFEDVWQRHSSKSRDPTVLAGLMAVQRRSVDVPNGTLRAWLKDFWPAVSETTPPLAERALKNLIQLDGTQYRLEYRESSSSNSFSFRLLGSELGERNGDLPIVKWMNTLRGEVSKLSNQPSISAPRHKE